MGSFLSRHKYAIYDSINIVAPLGVCLVGFYIHLQEQKQTTELNDGLKIILQSLFYMANYAYYYYYDNCKTDCLSRTYIQDKYGIVLYYACLQMILNAYHKRMNFRWNNNCKTINDMFLIIEMFRWGKVMLLNMIFNKNTSSVDIGQRNMHSVAVGCLVITEFISRFFLQQKFNFKVKYLDAFFALLWGICFLCMKPFVIKDPTFRHFPNNVSWTFETLLLTSTLSEI